MRAELYRPEEPETVVAVATWDGSSARIEPAGDPPPGLDAILRPVPVVVDDPSLRWPGTRGETLLEPGTFEWFRSALLARAPALGLSVRFVVSVREGGWDPAAQYRTFEEQVERLTSRP
ncbi:MAG TPA: hypothetical protein VFT27_08570 [Actinomycetota bacterium]|nr:hypothetical protein [Actinomycetota bacterium]